jgi:hypothetical protein
LLNLNPRRIRYCTIIIGKVLPKRKNTVRMNQKLTVEEDLQGRRPDATKPGTSTEKHRDHHL